ncbi:MAG TPA: hypothetical protein VHM90_14455, partial [Phycisphaerae bacterium]|nr:hypothetical protein [Phycisphaerae bacterium]
MDRHTVKTAVISSAATTFIIVAFLMGTKLASTTGGPPTPPAPDFAQAPATPAPESQPLPSATPATSDAVVDHLLSVEARTQRALDYMKKASANGKGGNVESARNQLAQAVDNLSAAIAYAREHPDIARDPAPPAALDISPQLGIPQVGRAAPNLRT